MYTLREEILLLPKEGYTNFLLLIEKEIQNIHRKWRESVSVAFKKSLEEVGWPHQIDGPNLDPQKMSKFIETFEALANLTQISKELSQEQSNENIHNLIHPFDLMMDSVKIRFKFHFEGKRPTNRLDKPEWFLTHILNLFEHHFSLFSMLQQYVISFDTCDRFSEILLGLVKRKIEKTVPRILSTPSLLSHFVNELFVFDANLQTIIDFGREDDGLLKFGFEMFSEQQNWVDEWIRVEQKCKSRLLLFFLILVSFFFENDKINC